MDRELNRLLEQAQVLVPPVSARVDRIRERIATAAIQAGRDPAEIRLVAVTKGRDLAAAAAAVLAGSTDLGENRVDELVDKAEDLAAVGEESGIALPSWHFIGHLQRNKARRVIGVASMIHSLESLDLASEILRRCQAAGERPPKVLVEVNLTGESQKYGVSREGLTEFVEAVIEIGLTPEGLMCMARQGASKSEQMSVFTALRECRDDLESQGTRLPELSMGMTDDFEAAVACGSTLVRVGRAIFTEYA